MAGDGGGDRMPAKATGSSARLEAGEGDDGHEDGRDDGVCDQNLSGKRTSPSFWIIAVLEKFGFLPPQTTGFAKLVL